MATPPLDQQHLHPLHSSDTIFRPNVYSHTARLFFVITHARPSGGLLSDQ